MRFVNGFFRFWYDFIIGDDWKIAAAVAVALGVTLAALLTGVVAGSLVAVVGGVALLAGFSFSLLVDTRRR